MYYQKVGDVYDAGTGRPIEPDFPSGSLDFQTRVEEYRIVGSKGQQVGISSIKACLLYTSPSPRDGLLSRMPSSA